MNVDATRQLALERRARLAAERRLVQRQADLSRSNAEMEKRARGLTESILQKRDELDRLKGELDEQRDRTRAAQAACQIARDERARSETHLWLALEAMRDGFAVYDAEHRMISANRAFLTVFDGLEEVAPGIAYERLCEILLEEGIVDPGPDPGAWLSAMKARWQADQIPGETLCLWNGQFIALNDRRLPDGGVVSLGLNQTEQERLASAIEVIPDGFVIFDRDDRLVMCNRKYRELYPGPADKIRPGVVFHDLVREGVASGSYLDAIGREDAWIEERFQAYQAPDGTPSEHALAGGAWMRSQEVEIPDGGRAGVRIDITQAKRNEIELQDAREAAEAASHAKSRFLTNMNHELRTPLNGILGIASLMRERAADDETKTMVRMLDNSARGLLSIIEHVLDTVSMGSGLVSVARQPFNLIDTIAQVVLLLGPQMHLRDVDLVIAYPETCPSDFIGDDMRLRQVLAALLGNAVKFAGGRIVLRVDGCRRDDSDTWDLQIEVEDFGPGIPDAAAGRIFGAFTQGDDSCARHHDGTGLGLSLARSLLDLMQGGIALDPAKTDGALFRVSLALPVAQGADHGPDARGLPVCTFVHDDDAVGHLLKRRLVALGVPIDGRTLAALPAPDVPPRPLIVQTGLLSADTDARLRRLRAIPHTGRVLVGSHTLASTLDLRDWDYVAGPPIQTEALLAILSRDPGTAGPDGDTDPPPRKLRVLAAEDNMTNQLILRKMLAQFDVDLTLVGSGAEAVAAVAADPPDLVLMDISMPGMDGTEAARRIRAWQAEREHRHIPIIALTAHADPGTRQKILDAGLDACLVKPLDRDKLDAEIARARAGLTGA
ncbi:PAS-domain containing protein [Maribius pontilimi]|uniref:histidine kinase n=1 Tax=Palleronia pontilimi TaxID=1964209 RepID=A0A934ICV7_9RHOB|nr:PAS-domain containing protein [Palleronia pontilimi]MBJ3763326.1 PAS-domain containing protein [Palleronia pontilimi]